MLVYFYLVSHYVDAYYFGIIDKFFELIIIYRDFFIGHFDFFLWMYKRDKLREGLVINNVKDTVYNV
jgi:hypothetical protein